MDGQEEVTNNQTESTETVTETADTKAETTETKSDGATGETGEPKFKDPNMEAKFTQTMQELSEEKKTYAKGKEKVEAFDNLMKDAEVVKYLQSWHDRKTGKAQEEIESISDEDFDRASTSRESFQDIVDKRSRAIAKSEYGNKINHLETRLNSMRLEQDIDDFANAKGKDGGLLHDDFWKLDDAGKLEPYFISLRNSGMSGIQVVEAAYKLAKYPNLKAEAMKEAHTVVSKKKEAIGEKGGNADSSADTKKLSMLDFARRKAKELNMEVP